MYHTYALTITSEAINLNKTLETAGPATNQFPIVTYFEVFAHPMIQPRTVPLSQATTISYFFSTL